MIVSDVMKRDIFTISPEAKLREIIELLYHKKISGTVVVDAKGKMQGIISEKDIYRVLYPSYKEYMTSPEVYTDFQKQEKSILDKEDVRVKEIMTKDPITISPDAHIMQAGALMLARHIHRIPVVDVKKELVGVISRGMVYRTIFRKEFHLR